MVVSTIFLEIEYYFQSFQNKEIQSHLVVGNFQKKKVPNIKIRLMELKYTQRARRCMALIGLKKKLRGLTS